MKVLIKNNTIRVTFISWWDISDGIDINCFNISDRFFLNLIERTFNCKCKIVDNDNKPDIIFVSVFNENREYVVDYLKNHDLSLKIFYTGENLDSRYTEYNDYLLNHVDITLGFKKFNDNKSLRFPIWLTSTFDKKTFWDLLRDNPKFDLNKYFKQDDFDESKRGFCSLCCSWGGLLNREMAFVCLNNYKPVNSGGSFLNNSLMLANMNQDISAYYNNFNFNLCMENSKGTQYTTEKVFNAIYAGTIPIYYNDDIPEPDVLNNERIINLRDENIMDVIKYYDNNYRKIFNLNIFTEKANEVILNYYNSFILSLKKFISRS